MSRPASILDHLRKYLATLSLGAITIGSLIGGSLSAAQPVARPNSLPIASAIDNAPLSHAEVYARTVRSTVMLLCPQKDGMHLSTGSGVILDKARGLVLTNHHVVGTAVTANACLADFSADGEVISEPSHYEKAKLIKGRVIDSDPSRDLALVQFEGLPEEATQVPVAAHGPRIGDTVLSVGCPQKARALWVLTVGTVRVNSRRTITYQDGQTIDAKIALTDSMTNPGDSGGPVVNQQGELVALVSGKATEADALTFFIDLSEVQHFVAATDVLINAKTAEELLARAEHFASKGKNEAALADLTAALEMEPDNMQLIARRGEVLMAMNKLDEAIVDLSEAIDAGNAPASTLSARGWCFLWKNDLDSARGDFAAAINLDRKLVKAYHGRGLVHMKGNKHALAIADFTRATKLDPNNGTYFNERGHAYFAQENYEKALADYNEAIRLMPNDWVLHSNKGGALKRLGRAAHAVAAFTEAIKLHANNAWLFNDRGVAAFSAGDFRLAVEDFTAAIKLDDKVATFWNNRGNAFGRLGQLDNAKADYEMGLKLDPKSGEHQEFANQIAEANRRPANRRGPQPQPPVRDERRDEVPANDGNDEGNVEEPVTDDGNGPVNEEESRSTLPSQIVGGWMARLQTQAGPRYLKMAFAASGEYVAVLTDAKGQVLGKDAGVASFQNGELVTKSLTGGIEKSRIQFRGGSMIATISESAEQAAIGATLEFTRM